LTEQVQFIAIGRASSVCCLSTEQIGIFHWNPNILIKQYVSNQSQKAAIFAVHRFNREVLYFHVIAQALYTLLCQDKMNVDINLGRKLY
jgi:hypothetical protein